LPASRAMLLPRAALKTLLLWGVLVTIARLPYDMLRLPVLVLMLLLLNMLWLMLLMIRLTLFLLSVLRLPLLLSMICFGSGLLVLVVLLFGMILLIALHFVLCIDGSSDSEKHRQNSCAGEFGYFH
jgi:hypothetical protein